MAMPRSAAATAFMDLPAISSSPEVISSSPAIMRSSVDLPQPDGPTKTTSSRSAMASDTSRTASTLPKDLATLFSPTDANSSILRLDGPHLDLDQETRQQHGLHGSPDRQRLDHHLFIDRVEAGPLAEVGQIDVDLEDVAQRAIGAGQLGGAIIQRGPRLLLNRGADHLAVHV